ncbi:hypothetical protein ACFY2T_26460 [Streptomyces sp. NPDC001260]|uniref:hypothetical protein n=1 Tax=Streptomyces sp. NPDC001260 TaxID=3364551 RepID=UPI0036AA1A38
MRAAVDGAGFLLPVGAGGVAAGATVWTVAQVWRTCDVGNGSANGAVLLLLLPVLWGVFAALWTAVLRAFGAGRRTGAVAAALCVSVGLAWALVSWVGVLDSYSAPVCPGNVPPWWPEVIPV